MFALPNSQTMYLLEQPPSWRASGYKPNWNSHDSVLSATTAHKIPIRVSFFKRINTFIDTPIDNRSAEHPDYSRERYRIFALVSHIFLVEYENVWRVSADPITDDLWQCSAKGISMLPIMKSIVARTFYDATAAVRRFLTMYLPRRAVADTS